MRMVKNELITKDQMMVAACQVKLVSIEIFGLWDGEPWEPWGPRVPSSLTYNRADLGPITVFQFWIKFKLQFLKSN